MIPTPTERALLNEYRVERKRLLDRLNHIESWMAKFTPDNGASAAQGSTAEEKPVARTIRTEIRKWLQAQDSPKAAPEVAKAMEKENFFPTYKQTKSNVDSTLARMLSNREIEKNDDGYWIKKAETVAA